MAFSQVSYELQTNIVRRFHELPKSALNHEFLVQRYIENPYIIDKKKFDLRIYAVIKGIDPLEAYLCDEGLARFCTVLFFPYLSSQTTENQMVSI